MLRLMALVPLVLLAVAGCGGGDQAPAATTTKPATTAPATTTTSAAPVKPTLASLVADPCKAISDADSTRLDVFIPGAPIPSDKSTCNWGASGALVSFKAYPKEDRTKAASAKNVPVSTLDGHRAKLGQLSHGSDTSYVVLVVVGSGSFQLIAVGYGEQAPGPDPLTVAKNFAKAILKQLD